MALVLGRRREPAMADLAPPRRPALGRGVAVLARQVVMIPEVFAGHPAQDVDRVLADRVFLVAEAFDQPLDAVAQPRRLVPLAPLALAGAEVLRGQRGQRPSRVLAAAIAALDHADQVRD